MTEIGFELPDDAIDIGHDHFITYFEWAPDRTLNHQYEGIADEDRCGVMMYHKTPEGRYCGGGVTFETPAMRAVHRGPMWKVESEEPLTLSPSILCSCGDHGFIRDGRWHPA